MINIQLRVQKSMRRSLIFRDFSLVDLTVRTFRTSFLTTWMAFDCEEGCN
jgi:hypothetical protein